MKKKRVFVLGTGGEKVIGFLQRHGVEACGAPSAAGADGADGADVLLLLPSAGSDAYRAAAKLCPKACVLTVDQPLEGAVCLKGALTPAALLQTLRVALALQERVQALEGENSRLKRTLGELKLIDRAKCSLVRHCDMSEQEAHRYIEKTAMDKRLPRRAVAEAILAEYEK